MKQTYLQYMRDIVTNILSDILHIVYTFKQQTLVFIYICHFNIY